MTQREFPTKSITGSSMGKSTPITPEERKELDQWHKDLGQSIVDNLNRNTKDSESDETP